MRKAEWELLGRGRRDRGRQADGDEAEQDGAETERQSGEEEKQRGIGRKVLGLLDTSVP